MNINDSFPSSFLKASDLGGKKVELEISSVKVEKIGDDTKPVVYFAGKSKGLVLNKTNASVIAAAHGPETDGWSGQKVKLYPTKVQFQSNMVDAIRVEMPVAEAFEDDDIPF